MTKHNHYFALITILSVVISLIGLIVVYNASVVEAFTDFSDRYYFAKQQLVWLSLGLVVYFVTSRFGPKHLKKISFAFFVLSLIAMILVLVPGVGLRLQGARRWISLGPFRFQPSELLKTSLVIYLATWLETPKDIKKFAVLLAVCLGLIMLQPDLGTAVIVAALGFGLFYLSGSAIKEIVLFFTCLIAGAVILIIASPYRLERLKTFLDPISDPLGRSYHINQVLIGLGSGGLSGIGLGRSRQKYSYLPEATTDSIFTIVGEELGFIGGVFLITLLLSLSLLAFRVASQAGDQFSRLLAAGVALLFSTQTFVNLASMVALVPLTGVPLPLISYGGSSLVTTFLALGILASVARHI
ncbi:putative lipid II flippase FtsW [Candidatus Collierbacteria bacterium]|nr:putative lipid II flippase FtsW [Candidatus Collierbacteria bacterium]